MNEERKAAFAEEEYSRRIYAPHAIEHCFELIADQEAVNGKDLCDFTTTEIVTAYKIINTPSAGVLRKLNSLYKYYTQWCFEKGYVKDAQNHYAELSASELAKYVNKNLRKEKILDVSEVKSIAAQCSSINPVDAFLLLGLFEGICNDFEEFVQIKITDFDKESKTIKLASGRAPHFSRELYLYAKAASEAFVMNNYIAPDCKNPAILNRAPLALSGNDEIFKLSTNINYCSHYFARRIKTIVKYYSKEKQSLITIKTSGKVNWLKDAMVKYNLDKETIFLNADAMSEFRNQFGITDVHGLAWQDYL